MSRRFLRALSLKINPWWHAAVCRDQSRQSDKGLGVYIGCLTFKSCAQELHLGAARKPKKIFRSLVTAASEPATNKMVLSHNMCLLPRAFTGAGQARFSKFILYSLLSILIYFVYFQEFCGRVTFVAKWLCVIAQYYHSIKSGFWRYKWLNLIAVGEGVLRIKKCSTLITVYLGGHKTHSEKY
jgi:hypothetical protein